VSSPRQIAFGPDGNLYVGSQDTASVKRYSGSTGEYLDDFVASGSGGLSFGFGVAFGPDGNLYVGWALTRDGTQEDEPDKAYVLRYNGATGAFIDRFGPPLWSGAVLLFNKRVTQTGTSVPVTPIPTTSLTFDSVTAPGQTSVTPLDSASASLPANFQVVESTGGYTTYFDITTTAAFNGSVTLAINYDPAQISAGRLPGLLHFENGIWADITTSVDAANHKVYGVTKSFSPFVLATRNPVSWSGVLQPVNANGTSVFRRGSTVPVKFALTGPSAGITTLAARLYWAKVSNDVVGTELEAVSTAAATAGNLFRYSGGQYVFNLSTKDGTVGRRVGNARRHRRPPSWPADRYQGYY